MLEYLYWGIAVVAFIFLLWQMTKRIAIPVAFMEFTGGEKVTITGHVRMIEKIKLKSAKPHPLYAGNNDFYVTVQNGKVKYHSRYVLDTITPIIRDADDILFFRIQARMVGGKVRSIVQTNLSKPNVTLQWRTKEE